MRILNLAGLSAALLAAFAAPAQGGDRRSPAEGDAACANFRVEPQLSIRETGRRGEFRSFEISVAVSVSNNCPVPLQVEPGTALQFSTTFPERIERNPQPPGCGGRRWSFSGLIPPHQRQRFVLRVRPCRYPADAGAPPRVVLESGRVVTSAGEKPIPALSRAAGG